MEILAQYKKKGVELMLAETSLNRVITKSLCTWLSVFV